MIRNAAGPEILSRTVMSHIDRTLFSTEQQLQVAQTGAVLEYDLFGMEVRAFVVACYSNSLSLSLFAIACHLRAE